jgi:hypothetical protein
MVDESVFWLTDGRPCFVNDKWRGKCIKNAMFTIQMKLICAAQ